MKIGSRLRRIGGGRARLGVGVKHGEVELVFDRVQIDKEIVNLVQDLLRPRIWAIDLVDDDDRRQLGLERFRKHVAGLRQRALRGIDQEHDAIDHLECALDLAAEVGVTWRIDNVDLGVFEMDRRVLGQDGDAALAFELV